MENKLNIQKIAKALELLLPNYSYKAPSEERSYAISRFAYLVNTDEPGKSIRLEALKPYSWDDNPPGKIEVTGEYLGGDPYAGCYPKGEKPKARCSMSRPMADIAKDITRRFMPAYNELFASSKDKYLKAEKVKMEEGRKLEVLRKRLKNAAGMKKECGDDFIFSSKDGNTTQRVEIGYSNSIGFPMMYVSADLGEQIIRLIRNYKSKK